MENIREATAYMKTEMLLTNYKKFKKGIENKELLIDEYSQEGLPQSSKSIVKYSSECDFSGDADFEKQEEIIESLKDNIKVTKLLINLIEAALKEIERDPYFEIITLKYFEDYTIAEIALKIHCEASTVSRNRSRLVRELSTILFSDEVLRELYGLSVQ